MTKTNETAQSQAQKASDDRVKQNAPALPILTDEERKEAQKEGLKEAAKESAKGAFLNMTDANLAGDPADAPRFQGPYEVSLIEHLVDLPEDELRKTVAEDAEPALSEHQVAGLLEVEKSGKNRDYVVDALMDRLGIDNPGEATGAGPAYENATSRRQR